MFSGVKLLCGGVRDKKHPFIQCLQPIIVPEDRFHKIANMHFQCPSCGHKSKYIQPYFLSLIKLKQAAANFDKTGVYVHSYGVTIQNSYEDGIELTPHVLENDDWTYWNMQIASINIAVSESSSYRMELWEDHNFKARPFMHSFQSAMMFGSVLRRHSLHIYTYEVDISTLQALIKEIRNYNNAWVKLMDSFVSAAPVDLNDVLYTHLAGVDSLDELFPENERYS